MVGCRVQDTRNRKGMDPFPCKAVGAVGFASFARAVDERIAVTCITYPPDEHHVHAVECPSVPGCVSQGRTEEEAMDNIADAIRECLAVRAERGMLLVVDTREVEITPA